MQFIEIQEGVSVNVSKIEGLKEVNGGMCEVYVGTRTYLSTLPYETITQMLRLENVVDNGLSKSENVEKTMAKLSKVLDKAQHFAG